jgi:hypothetical protein
MICYPDLRFICALQGAKGKERPYHATPSLASQMKTVRLVAILQNTLHAIKQIVTATLQTPYE